MLAEMVPDSGQPPLERRSCGERCSIPGFLRPPTSRPPLELTRAAGRAGSSCWSVPSVGACRPTGPPFGWGDSTGRAASRWVARVRLYLPPHPSQRYPSETARRPGPQLPSATAGEKLSRIATKGGTGAAASMPLATSGHLNRWG
jgi:hypothetical protein